jgi:hypothetical protein
MTSLKRWITFSSPSGRTLTPKIPEVEDERERVAGLREE